MKRFYKLLLLCLLVITGEGNILKANAVDATYPHAVVDTEAVTVTVDGTLGGKTDATEEDINALVDQLKAYVDGGITTIIVTGSEPALIYIDYIDSYMPAVSEALYRLTDKLYGDSPYCGTIDLILPDVTEIVDDEFNNTFALNSITLPKVTTVGDGAFYATLYLQKLTFGSVITFVDEKSSGPFHMDGYEVGGCDLVLNCGQLQAEDKYKPNFETNVWFIGDWSGEYKWKSITLTHTGGIATCTEKAVCETCGEEYGEVADHTFVDGKCVCGAYEITIGTISVTPWAAVVAGDNQRMWEQGDSFTLHLFNQDDPTKTEVHTVTYDGEKWSMPISSILPAYFVAYMGDGVTVTSPTEYFVESFEITEDQSDANKLKDADVVIAMGTVSGDAALDLLFEHYYAKATFNVVLASQFNPETDAISEFYVVTCDGDYVKPYIDGNSYTALVPANPYFKAGVHFALVTINEERFEVLIPDEYANPNGSLVAGTHYTFKLLITADGAYIVVCADECSFEYTDNGDGTHKKVCSECSCVVASENHTLTYTASGNVITATCSANCGYSNTATISAANTTYDGTEQKTATVTYSEGWTGGELTITYENNVNAGTATASITLGEATASVEFTIAKAEVDFHTFIDPEFAKGLVYDGTEKALVTAHGSVEGGTIVFSLVPNGEYTTTIPVATEAGEYVVYYFIRGDENHQDLGAPGEAYCTVYIEAKLVTDATVTLGEYDSIYNGTTKEPGVASVVVDGRTLVEGTDYTVSYENNVYVGTATVIITFKGNYTGSVTVTFEITQDTITSVPAPENLVAEATSTSSIALTWNKVQHALSYNIYQNEEMIANVADTNYVVENLDYNTEYCFTVTSVRYEKESEKSEIVCVKTLGESIEELTSSLLLYPNPVNDKLYIETEVEVEEVVVYTITGVFVGQQTTDNGQQTSSIDVSNLKSGVYFVKIVTSEGETVKRFVKK